jgi:hypothetical protein
VSKKSPKRASICSETHGISKACLLEQ